MNIFKEDHDRFRQKVREFVREEINPYAGKWEKERGLPRELWKKMGGMGFLGMCYSKDYGGRQADDGFEIVLLEELANSGCSGLAQTIAVHNDMTSTYLNHFGTHDQKKKYLQPCTTGAAICAVAVTEPDTGSDVSAIQTHAVKDGNHYVLNGRKIYITNGYYGDIVITAAKTKPKAKPGYKGISLFIVEKGTKGFIIEKKLEKLGTHASDTAELVYDNCLVPAENLLGVENDGFKCIMTCFQRERLMATVVALASTQRMIREIVAHVKTRTLDGLPFSSLQFVKHRIVEMVSEYEMTKAFVYHCCEEYMVGRDMIKEISMAKYLTGELSQRVARSCLQLHDGGDCFHPSVIYRGYADARLNTIAGGTTEIMKEIIADKIGL